MAAAYSDFATVYDELMDATPYEEWRDRIVKLIQKYGVSKPQRNAEDELTSEKNLVLDLGCGTGTLTELLYEQGYDMVGVDNSEAMLGIAMEKRMNKRWRIRPHQKGASYELGIAEAQGRVEWVKMKVMDGLPNSTNC